MFAGHLSVILYLYMDKMRPVGLQPHPVEGPAGYSVMVRQTLNEDLSQIQRKFLEIFHVVRIHDTLRRR